MPIAAVVVNYNAGEALQRCVRALYASTLKADVLVIDNASTDGSAQLLNQKYGNRAGLELLFNPRNDGFAVAANRAIERLAAEWVLVINPDCALGTNTLALLKQALESAPRAALAAPAVRDTHGRLEKAALRRFPDPWNSLMTILGLWRFGRWLPWLKGIPIPPPAENGQAVVAEAVSGACMLLRRQAFLDVGSFDENYGLHCEDLDLMYRLRESGWHCLYVPAAGAVHEQGVSSRSRPLWVHRQKHRGMQRFFNKFQARQHALPMRWLVRAGIWLHYLATLPGAWLRR